MYHIKEQTFPFSMMLIVYFILLITAHGVWEEISARNRRAEISDKADAGDGKAGEEEVGGRRRDQEDQQNGGEDLRSVQKPLRY